MCATCVKQFGLGKVNISDELSGGSLAGAVVGAYYDGSVKEMILRLKFHRLRSAEEAAAELVAQALPEGWPLALVTSVPVSAGRYRERGYNQSELVARRVAKRLGLPYSQLLGRHNSSHQLGVDRRTRLEQVKGVFFALRAAGGRNVLVVDDVVTTGATMAECADTLKAAGAGFVYAAAIARH